MQGQINAQTRPDIALCYIRARLGRTVRLPLPGSSRRCPIRNDCSFFDGVEARSRLRPTTGTALVGQRQTMA